MASMLCHLSARKPDFPQTTNAKLEPQGAVTTTNRALKNKFGFRVWRLEFSARHKGLHTNIP